jgi:hypothetical protein
MIDTLVGPCCASNGRCDLHLRQLDSALHAAEQELTLLLCSLYNRAYRRVSASARVLAMGKVDGFLAEEEVCASAHKRLHK